jgi:hypothetical protein
MYKIEPMELIENPLATVTEECSSPTLSSPSTALLHLQQQKRNKSVNNSAGGGMMGMGMGSGGRKRHSLGPPSQAQEGNCTKGELLDADGIGIPQSQSQHLIGREAKG